MAIPAIDPKTGDVMLMAKRNSLVPRNTDAGNVIGTNELCPSPSQTDQEKDRAEDAYL